MELEKIITIAKHLNMEPEKLTELFFGIGVIVMNKTVEHLKEELEEKLNELFPVVLRKMSEEDYNDLLTILKGFIK